MTAVTLMDVRRKLDEIIATIDKILKNEIGKDDTVPGCICTFGYPLNPNRCETCYWIEECKRCSP